MGRISILGPSCRFKGLSENAPSVKTVKSLGCRLVSKRLHQKLLTVRAVVGAALLPSGDGVQSAAQFGLDHPSGPVAQLFRVDISHAECNLRRRSDEHALT